MKKRGAVLMAATLAFSIAGIAIASAAGTPMIDPVNASFNAAPVAAPAATNCVGVGGVVYDKIAGAWKGTETDVTPGSSPYNLTGTLKITKFVLTASTATGRGVATAKISLTDPTTTFVVYAGSLTLITQGLPEQSDRILGRGWIVAPTRTRGKADGNKILANVEVEIDAGGPTPTYAMTGMFGDVPAPVPGGPVKAFSAVTNGQTC